MKWVIVGPQRASQFQPGTSGNPRGRRKGSRSVGAILNGIMSQKVTVSEGGRTRRVSRLEVMLLRLSAWTRFGWTP
jgi:hypothetical protein